MKDTQRTLFHSSYSLKKNSETSLQEGNFLSSIYYLKPKIAKRTLFINNFQHPHQTREEEKRASTQKVTKTNYFHVIMKIECVYIVYKVSNKRSLLFLFYFSSFYIIFGEKKLYLGSLTT
jgi:hypothetical protein